MILGARSDTFRFELPKVFFPDAIVERWKPYVQRMPSATYAIHDLVNFSIQGIKIPNFNYSPVEQVKPGNDDFARGATRRWRTAMSPSEIIDKSFDVTLKTLDGYFNYWVMMECFFHWYDFAQKEPFIMDLPLRVLDGTGVVMYRITFHDCLFSSIDQVDLSFSEVAPDHRTFDCKFTFNEISVGFDLG